MTTAALGKSPYESAQLQRMADDVGFWWHSIDLGQGVVTNGHKTPSDLQLEFSALQIPDLTGKSVLDIGAYDGFYSFEAERRGAKRVVALDHYTWSLDLPKYLQQWKECKEKGVAPPQAEDSEFWHPESLPGKRGFDLAHKAIGSKVETVVGDFMAMDLSTLGTFDVVFYFGVLYHMDNPINAIRRLASVTKDLAIIETHAIVIPGYEHLEICELYSANQLNGDVSNWWGPNTKALAGMCRAAGFNESKAVGITPVETTHKRSMFKDPPKPDVIHFRAMMHARK